jgi:hypothetical protein
MSQHRVGDGRGAVGTQMPAIGLAQQPAVEGEVPSGAVNAGLMSR